MSIKLGDKTLAGVSDIDNLPAERVTATDPQSFGFTNTQGFIDVASEKLEGLEGNFLTASKNVYVDATNGDDIAGDGTQAKPWKTIQKAVDMCPSVQHDDCFYQIYIADGEYAENIYVKHKPYVSFVFSNVEDGVIINGTFTISFYSRVNFNKHATINIPSGVLNGVSCINSSFLYFNDSSNIKIIGNGSGRALYASDNSVVIIYSRGANIIKNAYNAVLIGVGCEMFINGLMIDSTCANGLTSLGKIQYTNSTFTNNATTKFGTSDGGRILANSQGWQLIGSVTGANSVAIDSELYAEFLVVQKYSGNRFTHYITSSEAKGNFGHITGGYNSNFNYHARIYVNGSNKKIQNNEMHQNNTFVLNDTTMIVYGKR